MGISKPDRIEMNQTNNTRRDKRYIKSADLKPGEIVVGYGRGGFVGFGSKLRGRGEKPLGTQMKKSKKRKVWVQRKSSIHLEPGKMDRGNALSFEGGAAGTTFSTGRGERENQKLNPSNGLEVSK